ncbi:MAG UNVERIFIED_CONTAM: helix-turn-helix domain-containing protein [Thermobifida fusca]
MSIQHMQSVFDATGLTSSEKIVLLAYCNYTDPHGYCWPGIERIADMTGLSRRGVMKIRKQLIERGLLATASRMGSDGIRKTNITRVNLRGLEALRRPERAYADDVAAAELGFKINPAETRSDQQRCTTCTMVDQQRCTTCTYKVNHVHLLGEPRAPYPLEDPSESSSSSGRTETAAPPRPRRSEEEEEKKTTNKKKRGDSETPRTKTPEDRAIRVVLDRLADHSPTEDEAQAVITHIRTQATQRGTTIARIDKWIDGRDTGALAADLAHVRATTRRQRPGTNTCKIHGDKRLPCIYCRMSAHAGDWTDLITELQRAGAEARPDLDALVHEYGKEHLLAA